MMKRVLLGLIVLVLVAAAGIYWFLGSDVIRGALEQQATAWLGHPVRIGSASGQLYPRVGVALHEVAIGEPARVTLADVNVSTGLRALFSRRIEDAEILIANSRIELPLPFAVPLGEGEAQTEGASEEGLEIVSVRSIALRDVRLVSRGHEITLSANAALDGRRLRLTDFTARANDTTLEASGTIDLEPRLEARLDASANQLDLDELLAIADAFTPSSSAASGRSTASTPAKVVADLRAERATAAGVELSELAGHLEAEGDHVTLSPFSFGLFGGRYEGKLDARMREALEIGLTSTITGLDVAQLAAFGGVADSISGTLSGTSRVAGRGRTVGEVLQRATGEGSATIADGTIRGLNLVRTVVLFFGRPASDAPEAAGDRFSRIAGDFTLAGQSVRTDSLTLQSQDVDVAARGSFTIPTKALDLRADLLLSESLSAQAGTDLARYTREGNRVVLPAVVSGTLSNPRVNIDASAALKRGLRNELDRRLKGLLDRLKPPPRP